ncbi:MBL fold metallo-hydrolase [Sphingobacterium haloxyli]|uniref:MBL fold metallo-hydrolase n=1 Tax=Sphingobacterium haloxyli TaxID=2100533 RepID=A0A2S9J0P2_9SPHI|nr:MBL fold metallo-hydrolase [Sphingobacterium haloxyli]PRD46347.1 MBL fold metallo-hydrolase [Sphingobacterium haloxyli]
MQILLILVVLLIVGGLLYLRHDRFGANATGERLARMQSKPNYKNGAFDNLEPTPALAEGVTYQDIIKGFFFTKKVRNAPQDSIPVVKSDLHTLPTDSNVYVWFGHSSYFIQLDGKRILVDPVFSKYATPVRISVRAFNSTYDYAVQDMPEIDILFITHDHWDHLDYNTFMQLKHKVKHIVTGLGVGAHLEKWGYPADQITELYWGDSLELDGMKITSTTSRHFSGRTFKRNTTLWSSFVLDGSKKLFLGGDSGYGQHFKEIGQQHGPFDFAILENGQYNEMWHYIHMMPEEVITATADLRATHVIPVHSAKFPLANHAWDEPLIRITKAAQESHVKLITPKIGQLVYMDSMASNMAWWEGLR